MRDHEALRVERVDPDVVVVAASPVVRVGERLAAVPRHAEAHRHEVQTLLVVRCDGEAHVVRRALGHVVVAAHQPPGVAAVVTAVQRGVLILDQRVHGVRVRGGDGDRDLAHQALRVGEPVARETLPGGASVPRDPEAAAGPAAVEMPRLHLELPHAGEQRVGVAGVDGEVRAAGVRVHEQRAGPGPAAVRGAVHATLLLGPVGAPERAHEHDVGARRVDDDARDPPGRIEPHVLPAAARVGGAVHAVAERGHRADEECLARAGPHHVVRRRRESEGPDRLGGLAVEDRLPVHAPVLGLPDPAGRGADVGDEGVARLAHDGDGPVPLGADEAVTQARPQGGVDLLGDQTQGEEREQRDDGADAGHGRRPRVKARSG